MAEGAFLTLTHSFPPCTLTCSGDATESGSFYCPGYETELRLTYVVFAEAVFGGVGNRPLQAPAGLGGSWLWEETDREGGYERAHLCLIDDDNGGNIIKMIPLPGWRRECDAHRVSVEMDLTQIIYTFEWTSSKTCVVVYQLHRPYNDDDNDDRGGSSPASVDNLGEQRQNRGSHRDSVVQTPSVRRTNS